MSVQSSSFSSFFSSSSLKKCPRSWMDESEKELGGGEEKSAAELHTYRISTSIVNERISSFAGCHFFVISQHISPLSSLIKALELARPCLQDICPFRTHIDTHHASYSQLAQPQASARGLRGYRRHSTGVLQ